MRDNNSYAVNLLMDVFKDLAEYMQDPGTNEIMINRPNDVWVERRGIVEKLSVTIDGNQIKSAMLLLANIVGKDLKDTGPGAILDAQLDGIRVAAVLQPISHFGHAICMRKHSAVKYSLDNWREQGAFNPNIKRAGAGEAIGMPSYEDIAQGNQHLQDFFRWAVANYKNIIISGPTSSGKTNLLNALIDTIPMRDRVISIEDAHELRVGVPNHVALVAKPADGVDMDMLVKLVLRFRPDRFIVGEVRGVEALSMMQGFNTGHPGGLCSLHADNALKALSRLEVLLLRAAGSWPLEAIRHEIATTFDYVIHMGRRAEKPYVAEILEVQGYDGRYITNRIYVTK